jgi:serine/threonine protein kinase
MGIVYRALDIRLNRHVALKILPPDLLAEEERRRRFVIEAQAAAALHDPRIATVFEIDEADGIAFIAMELIEGSGLTARLSGGRLPVDETLAISLDVAEGLALAHRKGILHRDLKPSNIMIGDSGRAKIIDFGLAKLLLQVREEKSPGGSPSSASSNIPKEPASDLTQSGHRMGTLSYMSPEQAAGTPAQAQSDVYSFGVVLYEMLTGQRPFDGDGRSLLAPLAADARCFQPILDRCLATSVAARYPSAEDLAADLRWLAQGMGRQSADSVRWPRAARWPLLGTLVLVVLSMTWVLLVPFRSGARRTSRIVASGAASDLRFANPRQITSTAGRAEFATWAPDGSAVAYHSNQSGNFDIWITRLDGSDPVDLTASFGGDDVYPVWSPDGTRIAFYSEREGGGYFVAPSTGESPRRIFSPSDEIEPLLRGPCQWSPDGTKLAMVFNAFRAVFSVGSTWPGHRTAVTSPTSMRWP